MIEFDENVWQKLNELKNEFDDACQKLLLEEVLIDNKLTIKLQKQKSKLQPIVDELQTLQNLEYDCANFTSQEGQDLQDEIAQIESQIQIVKRRILDMLANIETQSQSVCIYLLASNNLSTEFCRDLVSSIKNFCGKMEFDFAESQSQNSENGTRSAQLFVSGQNCQNLLECLNGVHKKAGTNQSVLVTIFPKIDEKMPNFDEKNLKIEIFRSNGAGGQNVNKVSTAVRVKHIPSNIVSSCQDERSQFQNKQRAIENLQQKVLKKWQDDQKKQLDKSKKKYENHNIVCTYDYGGLVRCLATDNVVLTSDFLQGDFAQFLQNNMISAKKK